MTQVIFNSRQVLYFSVTTLKFYSMKALAKLKNLESESCKNTIIRNLHRILDIRIIDIDVEKSTMLFLYANPISFQQVCQELERIGYPIIEVDHSTTQRPCFKTRLASAVS